MKEVVWIEQSKTEKITCYYRQDDPQYRKDEWSDGYIGYWFDGISHSLKAHREDGPAINHPDGRQEWYYLGQKVPCQSQEEFESYMKLKAFW